MLPLEFIAPLASQSIVRKGSSARAMTEGLLNLLFAETHLLEWGTGNNDYVRQQIYSSGGSILALVTISVTSHTLLQVRCPKGFTALQYTLKNKSFAYLAGHGNLPLFEYTYTLQYIPEGIHKILLAPGTYQYLYMASAELLNSLAKHDQNIQRLVQYQDTTNADGAFAERHPFDGTVNELLKKLQSIGASSPQTPFDVSFLVSSFVLHYYEQLKNNDTSRKGISLKARLNAFLANHIDSAVVDIIQQLRENFYINRKPLATYWKKANAQSPRNSVKSLRMTFALYLLVVERLPVHEVSKRLNYSDQFVFSRLFSKYYGVAPRNVLSIITM